MLRYCVLIYITRAPTRIASGARGGPWRSAAARARFDEESNRAAPAETPYKTGTVVESVMPTSSLQLSRTVCITTGIGILYPWMLPFLAKGGFAERGSDSVSEYIANAHATGAMAVATAGPLYWIVRFQETFVAPDTPHSRWLWVTLATQLAL